MFSPMAQFAMLDWNSFGTSVLLDSILACRWVSSNAADSCVVVSSVVMVSLVLV
jgi:hypothetical protein